MNIYLDLYIDRSDRKLAGVETDDKIVSAPFPGISGFKKISFRSSGEGVLYIEEWDRGMWGLYDKIRAEGGGKTSIYIDSWRRALLYRIIYEPFLPRCSFQSFYIGSWSHLGVPPRP